MRETFLLLAFGLSLLIALCDIVFWKYYNIKAKREWILCSDRLPSEPPEEGWVEEYIVTVFNVDVGVFETTCLYYWGDGLWFDFGTDDFYFVFAWQPLPPAFRKTLYQRMMEE